MPTEPDTVHDCGAVLEKVKLVGANVKPGADGVAVTDAAAEIATLRAPLETPLPSVGYVGIEMVFAATIVTEDDDGELKCSRSAPVSI